MTGFDDDKNCNCCEDVITHEDHSNINFSGMRFDAQLWYNLFWTIGGALELTKCQYHLMNWDFTIACAPILNTGTNNNHINLISPVGDELRIKQLGCGTSYKTLGAFLEPLQHQSTKYKYLQSKATLWRLAPANTTTPGSTASASFFKASAMVSQSSTWLLNKSKTSKDQ
jgi:hypothetical protein